MPRASLIALATSALLGCSPPPPASLPYGGTIQFRELVPAHGSSTFRADVSLALGISGKAAYPTGCTFLSEVAAPAQVSSGTVSLSDNTISLAAMRFDATNHVYPSATSAAEPLLKWVSADPLSADSDGDQITAFSGTVLAPSHLAGVTPAALTGSATIPISLAGDFAVTWTPGDGQVVSLRLFDNATKASLTCNGPDSGTLVVPAAALATVLPSRSATATLARVNFLAGKSANADIDVVATTELTTGATFTK